VQNARAMRLPVIAIMAAIMAAATLPSTDARAQFACVGTLGASDVTCTNTGATAVPFLQDQLGTFNLATTSSGLSNGITTTSVDGNVTATNSGINADMLDTSASGLGNATSNNSGIIGTYISTLTGAGNATSTNSGTVGGSVATTADGGGNATANNSGVIGGLLSTQTNNGGSGSGGGNATSLNSGTVDSIANVTADGGNATVINSGKVLFSGSCCGPPVGIFNATAMGGDATTINHGNVNGGVITTTGLGGGDGNATLINYGTIRGDVLTLAGNTGGTGNATFINYGTIYTDFLGVGVGAYNGTVTGYNGGRIFGEVDVANGGGGGTVVFSNAGLIDGTYGLSPTGVALDLTQFDPATPTTLNILPGSRIVGQIILNGDVTDPFAVGTRVNILSGHDISSVLTFGGPGCGCGIFGGLTDTGAVVNITGGAPYVINGNTIAVLDPTSFANADRNVVDVTRTITSLVTSRLTNPAPMNGGGATTAIGFAPSGNVARDMANDAFSGIPALAYASNDRVLLSNPSFTAADGMSIWAQGFGGQRIQQADAPTLRSVSYFYGGVLGIDKTVQPDLRLGGFIGGGAIKSTIDLNSGDTSSDIFFGGLYGRYAMGRAFLDFSLLGGYSNNDVKRTIANNLVPGGYEYAAGKYNGWFVSPEIAYGLKQSLGYNLTLTPSARVRYLAAGFGGYQESGSSTNLTVASRTSHNFEERGELKLMHTTNATPTEQLQLSGSAGIIALQRVGDSNISTVLLGQSLAFATPGKGNIVGFYAGAGFDWRNASGVSVFGAAEFTAMSDQSQTITGRGGVKVSF